MYRLFIRNPIFQRLLLESHKETASMSRHVNNISNRLSLRPPQRDSLEALHHVFCELFCELIPPHRSATQKAALEDALKLINSKYPTVTDFERDFPSLCFALATGVGKTRLMGAFITYLHLAHGIRNFFVLAPNLTIYEKLIAESATSSYSPQTSPSTKSSLPTSNPIAQNTYSKASQNSPSTDLKLSPATTTKNLPPLQT